MAILAMPLFLIEGLDVSSYESLDDLILFVEPVDIRNQEYFMSDAEGRRIFLAAGRKKTLWGEIEVVQVDRIDETSTHSCELAVLLGAFLEYHGIDDRWVQRATLKELVDKACAALKYG